VSTEPPAEVFHAAAMGCLIASFMAGQLGYTLMATQLITAAGILEAYAQMIERRAARRPGPAVRARLTFHPGTAVNVALH
jgi:hypothetical protein